MSTKPFTPSSWLLQQQIAAAMAKCDADIDQARRAKEERETIRMEQAMTAAAVARGRRARWGV